MSWQDLTNDISVDITTLKLPPNSYTSAIASLPNADDRINLYPFKVVTLDFLIKSGKFMSVGNNYGSGFQTYSNKFKSSDN